MSGFIFGLTVNVPYTTVRDLARDYLAGRDLEIRPELAIRIDDLDLQQRGDRLEVTVGFVVTQLKGWPLKPAGRLVILGDPYLDPARRRLSIRNLELVVETDQMLVKVADKLLRPALLDYLAEALDFSIDDLLTPLVARTRDLQLGDHGYLRWQFTELELREVRADREGLGFHLGAEGHGVVRLIRDPDLI